MSILTFDIGGSSVKYAVWELESLEAQNSFLLPNSWIEMKEKLLEIVTEMKEKYIIEGVAFSAPGVVDSHKKEIRGVSAVSYIHNFDIFKELTELFELPVAMENDANCAALAEFWLGSAKSVSNAVFFVIGSGIGGAVIIDRKLIKGRNLFAGEFGYMPLNESSSLSEMASSVKTVEKYNKIKGTKIDGKELFKRATEQELLAKQLVSKFYRALARGIFNLLVCFDPEMVIIGGGISANDDLIPNIKSELDKLLIESGMVDFEYDIKPCEFRNDSNLIGAVYNYTQTIK